MINVQSQQVLVPKQVYIGDTAELLCSFNFNSESLKNLTSQGSAVLSVDNFLTPVDSREFQIKEINLIPAGVDYYQFKITFVPWKTGTITFPVYQMEDFSIEFEPVTIVSITEQKSITAIQQSNAPLLLPGTTYKLYGALIVLVLILFLGIRALVHHEQLEFYFKNQKLKRKYRKNASLAKKKLVALGQKKDISERQLASEIQKVMRNYLEVRFAYPFTRTVTSDLMKGYYEVTKGLLSDEKELAFEDFVAAFVRTDYIRYSKNAHFKDGELAQIVKNLVEKIAVIETPEVQSEKEDEKEEQNV